MAHDAAHEDLMKLTSRDLHVVTGKMPFETLLGLLESNVRIRSVVRREVQCRLLRELSSNFANFTDFQPVFRQSSSVVSGTFLLYVFDPARQPGYDHIDLYTSNDGFFPMLTFLLQQEQGVISAPQVQIQGLDRSSVKDAVDICTPHGHFHLIRSPTGEALYPLTLMNATHRMNAFTHSSLVLAYPALTLAGEGFVRHAGGGDNSEDAFSLHALTVPGYRDRCKDPTLCRHQLRRFGDTCCLTVTFMESEDNVRLSAGWTLGGGVCSPDCELAVLKADGML